jgi:hypothetical protein
MGADLTGTKARKVSPRSPFARTGYDLPLPKPFRGAILASKPPGIWRMSDNESAATPPAEEECPSCGRPMSVRARMCPTCRSYRQQWKNWLLYYGSAAGVIAIVISALTFVSDAGPRVWASIFGRDAVETVYFEYPGKSAFLNTGAREVVINSVSLDWPARHIELRIDLSIGKLIKPGEVIFVDIPSQYEEPKDINSALWRRGDAPSSLINEAFDIGEPQRCAVFHVYNLEHPVFRLLNSLHPERPLAFIPAEVFLNIYHISTKAPDSISMGQAQTAFLATNRCSR